jgi:hypothetical protein
LCWWASGTTALIKRPDSLRTGVREITDTSEFRE